MFVNTNVNGMATPTTHPLQPAVSMPPPGFPSHGPIVKPTPSGYNHGQIWRYPTTQGGNTQFPVVVSGRGIGMSTLRASTPGLTTTAVTTCVMATGMSQNPTSRQETVTSAAGPHPSGGSNRGGEGVYSVKYSQAVAGASTKSTGFNDRPAVTTQPSSHKHQGR